jgi:hypothetical protein
MRHDRRSSARASATNVEANSNRCSFCLATPRYKRQNVIVCSEALCRVVVNNKNHAIKITQAKTDEPLSLPLTKEVGEALIDYLKSGRPQTTHREVFLKVRPPFSPFTESISATLSRIGASCRGSPFGVHKNGTSILFAIRWRLGSWRKTRVCNDCGDPWGIPVWNQHVSTQKRI